MLPRVFEAVLESKRTARAAAAALQECIRLASNNSAARALEVLQEAVLHGFQPDRVTAEKLVKVMKDEPRSLAVQMTSRQPVLVSE